MYKVFEVDYTNRTFLKGKTEDIKEAKRIARKAFKESHGEFTVFISDGTKVVFDLR